MSEWRVAVLAIGANVLMVIAGLVVYATIVGLAVFVIWLFGQSI